MNLRQQKKLLKKSNKEILNISNKMTQKEYRRHIVNNNKNRLIMNRDYIFDEAQNKMVLKTDYYKKAPQSYIQFKAQCKKLYEKAYIQFSYNEPLFYFNEENDKYKLTLILHRKWHDGKTVESNIIEINKVLKRILLLLDLANIKYIDNTNQRFSIVGGTISIDKNSFEF